MNSEEREILDLAAQNLQATELLAKQGFYGIAASRGYYGFISLRHSYFGADYISTNIQQ